MDTDKLTIFIALTGIAVLEFGVVKLMTPLQVMGEVRPLTLA